MRELGRDGGVAWLAERLRRGDLARSMVELAAYAGSAEAREVLGTQHIPGGVNGPLGSYNGVVEGDIGAAAELIGEQRVREAICGRLIEWALR